MKVVGLQLVYPKIKTRIQRRKKIYKCHEEVLEWGILRISLL